MPRTYIPKPWPYAARAARESAAVEIATALTQTVHLADSQDDAETLRTLAKTIYHLQNALRHLESCGAQTRPVTPELIQLPLTGTSK